jgi:hypothetical protein
MSYPFHFHSETDNSLLKAIKLEPVEGYKLDFQRSRGKPLFVPLCDHAWTGQGEVKAGIKLGVPLAVAIPLRSTGKSPASSGWGQEKRLEIPSYPDHSKALLKLRPDTRGSASNIH